MLELKCTETIIVGLILFTIQPQIPNYVKRTHLEVVLEYMFAKSMHNNKSNKQKNTFIFLHCAYPNPSKCETDCTEKKAQVRSWNSRGTVFGCIVVCWTI